MFGLFKKKQIQEPTQKTKSISNFYLSQLQDDLLIGHKSITKLSDKDLKRLLLFWWDLSADNV